MNKWEKIIDDVKRTGGIVPPVEEGDPVVAVYDEDGRARVRPSELENATGVVINVTTGHFRIPDPGEGDIIVGQARHAGVVRHVHSVRGPQDNTGGRPHPGPETDKRLSGAYPDSVVYLVVDDHWVWEVHSKQIDRYSAKSIDIEHRDDGTYWAMVVSFDEGVYWYNMSQIRGYKVKQ